MSGTSTAHFDKKGQGQCGGRIFLAESLVRAKLAGHFSLQAGWSIF
jgi:hypothetical protein